MKYGGGSIMMRGMVVAASLNVDALAEGPGRLVRYQVKYMNLYVSLKSSY